MRELSMRLTSYPAAAPGGAIDVATGFDERGHGQ